MPFKIEKIAKLARLNLKPSEKVKLEKDLQSILKYVHKLDSLDVDHVEPTSHVLELENVYRPDEVRDCDIRDEVLKHAPLSEGAFFKVPKVVEK